MQPGIMLAYKTAVYYDRVLQVFRPISLHATRTTDGWMSNGFAKCVIGATARILRFSSNSGTRRTPAAFSMGGLGTKCRTICWRRDSVAEPGSAARSSNDKVTARQSQSRGYRFNYQCADSTTCRRASIGACAFRSAVPFLSRSTSP